MINILVVDDQNLTHKQIETYLQSDPEIEIVGFAKNGQEAIERTTSLQPDVVLMDVEMPRMDGLTATKIITQKFPLTKVVMLTVHDNERHLGQALQNGAKGYLLKTTQPLELKHAIQHVNQGYFQLSLELTEKYLYKIISEQSESKSVDKLKRKINYLYKSVDELKRKINYLYKSVDELKLENAPTNSLDEAVASKTAEMLQKEMISLQGRDSNLQFKVDRMKYNQERMQKDSSYLFKLQLACIVTAMLSLLCGITSNFN